MKIPADTRAVYLSGPQGRTARFRPNGKVQLVGQHVVANPELWASDEPMLAARLFVGFNVGAEPTWKMNDLITVVTRARVGQGHDPDASYLVQKGVYTSKKTGDTVTEDGAQVVLLNVSGEPQKSFEKEMTELAETIAGVLRQEEIIVEIQRGGIAVRTFGVVP